IAWIAAQPWSNGAVGMIGISWGCFNSLQVAALRPPALKAVISIASTVYRYNDDIHYKNGCHLSAQLSWAAPMLGYQSRPPDSA
ncbi:CocE/NonD family hydrolase, partial [Rhizobium leguminosarum]|uniref:CocE/NonD family hydrolase n=1 Tax=Rhizobium leguminosarum TaxID=384 RepID=UPI003F9CB7AF